MKRFKYDEIHYLLGVTVPAWLSICITFLGLYKWASGNENIIISIFGFFGFLIFVTHIFGISNPKEVIIDKAGLTVSGFKQSHNYKWEDLQRLSIRKVGNSQKLYLRIGKTSLLRGRYWVNLIYMENADILLKELEFHQDRIHPKLSKFQKYSVKPRDIIKAVD